MRSRISNVCWWKPQPVLFRIAIFGALGIVTFAAPQASQAAQSNQESFDTPEQAAKALIQAAGAYDVPQLLQVLGPDARDLVASEDSVRDKARSLEFAALAHEKQLISLDPQNNERATLSVGNEDWPFPIPLVERAGKWYFDAKDGREEILLRRIGENELDAINIARGFVEAQQEYAAERHDGAEANQYAQKIISTPGKHDGLAWQNADGSWGGPVGEAVAKALAEGHIPGHPFHGYYFKVLKGQGPAAPLGKMNFVVENAMIGGFALAAAPAQYRVTGVKTFLVGYDGVVYQKDLGPNTLKLFQRMELYNPDKSWQPTDDEP